MPALELNSEILLERLRRAREDQGLSQEEVAGQLGVARTTLVAIEAGQRRLRANELLDLSRIYSEPLDALLREKPAPRTLAAQFRTAAGEWPEQSQLRTSAAHLQGLAEDYVELERLTATPLGARYPPAHPGPGDLDHAEWLAQEERGRLQLGDGPLPHLREILENDVGLRIFSMVLPSKVGGLFGFDTELGACVAMNAQQRWERQRWSLAHEYAHFLTRREEAEITVVLSAYRRVPASERYADTFARHFLLPAAGVTRRYRAAVADTGKASPALLLEQANWWGVSFQAFTLRLECLRLLKLGTYEGLAARGFKVDEGRKALALSEHPADQALLPRRYRLLAVQAFNEALISEGRLARFLRVDRLAARQVVADLGEPLGVE